MAERSNLIIADDGVARCGWVGNDPEYLAYHDDEWGFPLHGDRALFEKMSLEGFQAGLSWITILRRRDGFREVFHDFEPAVVAAMTPDDVEALMLDARIIRNRAKIISTISNAAIVAELPDGALDELVWSFAPAARPQRPRSLADLPSSTPESIALSKTLRGMGFGFVGPTTMYALMQSGGLVDDHLEGCFRA